MGRQSTVNLVCAEPDRRLPFEHYPGRWVRRPMRGPEHPRGALRAFLNCFPELIKFGPVTSVATLVLTSRGQRL
jgi:hypothetical protein